MSDKLFLDTNILLYAVGDDDPRRAIAEELVAAGGVISVQTLNEFVSAGRGKFRWPWPRIEEALASFRTLLDPPLPLTADTHESAVGIARRYRLHIYDALIVASAAGSRCDLLLTEDMADGTRIAGVTIRNPFRVA
jgi:predicted nucleic acid-binding protein